MSTVPEHYISIYHPIKGWAPVCYGPDGPEYTGSGHRTPQEAIEEAKDMAAESGLPLNIPEKIEPCPVCGGWRLNDHCDDCDTKKMLKDLGYS
jgi:hypothetical protein